IVPVGSGSNIALESIETTFQQDLNGDGLIGVPPQPTTTIQTDGTTSLDQIGNNYFLNKVGVSNTGPQLKYSGAPVTALQFCSCTVICALQTAHGYDGACNFSANRPHPVSSPFPYTTLFRSIVPVGSGSNIALESIETTFQQDLNGDGLIGVPPQ